MRELVRKLYYAQTHFDIVGRRRLFYAVSAVGVALSMLALITLRLNLAIDFRGGTAWRLSHVADQGQVGSAAGTATPAEGQAEGASAGSLGQVSMPSEGKIREVLSIQGVVAEKVLYLGASQVEVQAAAVDAEIAQKVSEGLAALVGVPAERASEVVSVTSVSATWGGEISRKALRALVVFLLAAVVYISIRFQWRMAVAAVAALVHDIAITVGTYAITRFTVAPATVIATLTILGYSLYDDVVVFDRVKESESSGIAAKRSYEEVVNASLNQVLMRSLNTSLTSLLPVAALLGAGIILGVPTLKDFALALFVGIAAGTYSSIFVASPLLVTLGRGSARAVGLQSAKERALERARAGTAVGASPKTAVASKHATASSVGGRLDMLGDHPSSGDGEEVALSGADVGASTPTSRKNKKSRHGRGPRAGSSKSAKRKAKRKR